MSTHWKELCTCYMRSVIGNLLSTLGSLIGRWRAMRMDIKRKPWRSPSYLKWMRDKQCAVCGKQSNEGVDIIPAHQNFGGIYKHGFGSKTPDSYALPLCFHCHVLEHQCGSKDLWDDIDRCRLALELITEYLVWREIK